MSTKYDPKRAGSSGGGPNRGGSYQSRGSGGTGRGASGSGRGRDSFRGNADRERDRSTPNHYGPMQSVAQGHAVSVSCIRCLLRDSMSSSCKTGASV